MGLLVTGGLKGAVCALAVVALLPFQATATCWDHGNVGAASGKFIGTPSNGLKAKMELFTATAPAGHGVFHPMQILFENSPDRVGVGTYKGTGLVCPDDPTGWSIYMDGGSCPGSAGKALTAQAPPR